jgi:uncharacterized membrane protein (DUF485 family)
MDSPTLQTLQDPILLLPWPAFEVAAFPTENSFLHCVTYSEPCVSVDVGVRSMLVQDVADLCVAALSHPGARNTTLGCTWAPCFFCTGYPCDISPLVVSGPQWSPLLDRIGQPDTTPLEEKPHSTAVFVAVAVAFVAVAFALPFLSVFITVFIDAVATHSILGVVFGLPVLLIALIAWRVSVRDARLRQDPHCFDHISSDISF